MASSSCSSSSSSSCSNSSCSSCSCSSSSCSSSSSYAAFYAPTSSVPDTGSFEILFHQGNRILVNSGVAYDGYGNRIASDSRTRVNLDWTGITTGYAYLCVRMQSVPDPIDYVDHPVYVLPKSSKIRYDIEFYLSESVVAVNFDIGGVAYYPPIDSNGVIDGLVLGKVYRAIDDDSLPTSAPEMVPWRSPSLAVKNGVFFPLTGFNVA